MLERLMALSLRNRLLALLIVVLVAGVGAWAVATIPIDAFPDVTNIQVEVVSTAPGLSPLEIERFVTYPIEMSMRGLPGLTAMRSVTKYGISVVTVVFRDDVDIYFARQQVHERVADVERSLPGGVQCEMGPIATAMGEIYQFTLEGTRPADPAEEVEYLTQLRTLQDWVVAPLLKNVSGVTEVNSFGGYIQQFQVQLDPQALLKYDLSVDAVYQAIRNNNTNVGGGIADSHSEEFIIRGVGAIRSEADIASIVVKAAGGTPIFVRDIGQVAASHAIRQGAALANGREAVGGIVMMLRGENSWQVVERVEQKVRQINESNVLPDGVRIRPFYERSLVIEKSIHTVTAALIEGSILVLLVLLAFLGSLRAALVVIVALPLSALLTFAVMRVTGLNANLMSLGGLAISIGMIIDATIIQVENVQRHLSLDAAATSGNGERRLLTVLRAAVEVRRPSVFGELIIALTFVPIVTLQGMEGKMFSPLAYTVAIALLSSLLLSIFLIPSLCLFALKGVHREGPVERFFNRLYVPSLRWSMRHRLVVVAVAVLLLAAAVVIAPRLGTEFVPTMDEGAFDMDIQMVPGISLQTALDRTKLVEQRLKQFPEMDTIVSRTGQTGVAIEARGVDKTGFVGSLIPREKWTSASSREGLADKMREALEDVPGIVISFSQPIQCRIDELVAGTRAQVIVKLFGDDLAVLKRKANEMATALSRIDGAADLNVERVAGQPYIGITMNRDKVARYGMNVSDVLNVVEIAIGGKPVTQVYQGNRVFDCVLRFPDDRRRSAEAIGATLVDGPNGVRVPLQELADVRVEEGPAQISRENGQRRIGIEMNVSGRDIGGFVRDAQHALRGVALPAGYYLEWGGQFENQQRAMRRLLIIMPCVAALIFVLLLLTFNSAWLASLVLVNLPFAMVGGVFALFASGLYLSVPASVGFIVLFGVAVLNGLVLVSYLSQLRSTGLPVAEAVSQGCQTRLRPVLMTAAIAIFSLVPMVFATGPGSEVQRPLAVVVIGGLLTSTLLTLLVLPVIYGWYEQRRQSSRVPVGEVEC
ncbi:MAG: efflux RND transporter permease subunit [Bacteroidales bacterium]